MVIAGVVPAKGTSSRLPGKNRQLIRGVPLFLWAANNLSRVISKHRIFIDSDCDVILAEATAAGFQALKRPAALADNSVDGNRFMLWEAENIPCDVLVQHLPPMPFLREETLRKALEAIEQGSNSAFGVHRQHAYAWNEQGPAYDLLNIPNSFTLPELVCEGMGFYATRRQCLLTDRTRISQPYTMIDLDRFESIDIDYPRDLELARAAASGLLSDSPYLKGLAELKRERIRFIAMDLDGVLTDGRLYYSGEGEVMKSFHARDGRAIRSAMQAGIQVAFLSATERPDTARRRAEFLGVSLTAYACRDKAAQLEQWCRQLRIPAANTAYIGDDPQDIAAMNLAGFSACPADADEGVRRAAAVVLSGGGGRGCIAEFIHKYVLGERS